jgi:hypothetical protein
LRTGLTAGVPFTEVCEYVPQDGDAANVNGGYLLAGMDGVRRLRCCLCQRAAFRAPGAAGTKGRRRDASCRYHVHQYRIPNAHTQQQNVSVSEPMSHIADAGPAGHGGPEGHAGYRLAPAPAVWGDVVAFSALSNLETTRFSKRRVTSVGPPAPTSRRFMSASDLARRAIVCSWIPRS